MKKENFAKVLVLASLVGLAGCNDGSADKNAVTTDTNAAPSTTAATTTTQPATDVKVYEAKADYEAPPGTETLDVQVSLDSSKTITDVAFLGTSPHAKSRIYQGLFLEGIKQQIVGKKLADVGDYTVVNGSSLTSGGFNKAIAEIKSEAL